MSVKQTIPGFRYEMPKCGENWPTGMAEAFCPRECDVECSQHCKDEWNPAQCRKQCQKMCMNECLFVPCCTKAAICDDGKRLERESCKYSYYGGMETSEWVATGYC
ncbi:hypothetical protein ABZ128_09900 [Streptomyces sp. NPDC006326]|uniref:hypothetical protein n=1 Tax=Streptomyces sp. NPDC006326 TaxID=3156752 RepID=UPI0033A0120F